MPDGIHPAFRDKAASDTQKEAVDRVGVASSDIKKPKSMKDALETNLSRDRRDMKATQYYVEKGNRESKEATKVRRDKF